MKVYIITSLFGSFAIDENKNLLDYIPFPQNPKLAAQKFLESQEKIIEEEQKLLDRLKDKEVFFVIKKPSVNYEANKEVVDYFNEHLFDFAMKIFKTEQDFRNFFANASIELSKLKSKKQIQKDKIVGIVIGAIDELEKTINVFVERLREWYGLHFPEFERSLKDHRKFVEYVVKYGHRSKIKDYENLAKDSFGIDFDEKDVKQVQSFAKQILALYEEKEKLEDYLEKILNEIAPNLTALATPKIAAKLIAKAGSLEKLAKLSSSTIQLLGSEKALFRYLHGKGKPPKHGYIYLHPLIQKAPKKLRGKIARALASKLNMAVKIDYYSKENRVKELKKQLEERIMEIYRKHG